MLILFMSIIILMFLGIPVAISLGLSILLFIMFSTDLVSISWLVQGMFTSLDSFPLMAVPFFVLAGTLMSEGGLSQRLVKFTSSLVSGKKSGMPMVLIISCFFFGAISGSGPATVAAIGGIMIPSMVKSGYNRGFTSALASSAGSLGVIVPPSIPMVIYAIATGVSVSDLFMAGIFPGIIVAIVLVIVCIFTVKNNDDIIIDESKKSIKGVLQAALDAIWALLIPVIILGGIYSGIFTPTEAAVITVVYSLIITFFIYKTMTIKKLIKALIDSSAMVGSILFLAAFATPLGRLLTMMQIPTQIAEYISNFSQNPIVILLVLNLFLLIVGMFLDTLSAILILAPILLPIAVNVGVDPIHFGIIMVINLAIGFVTPPVGVNLLVGSNIGEVSFEEIVSKNKFLLLGLIIALLIITFVPALSTFLPELLKR